MLTKDIKTLAKKKHLQHSPASSLKRHAKYAPIRCHAACTGRERGNLAMLIRTAIASPQSPPFAPRTINNRRCHHAKPAFQLMEGIGVARRRFLLFGILAAIWPGLTLLWLLALFAVYALISGFASASAAIKNRHTNSDWWLLLLLGLMSVAAGAVAIIYPNSQRYSWWLDWRDCPGERVGHIIMAIRLRRSSRVKRYYFSMASFLSPSGYLCFSSPVPEHWPWCG